LIPSIIGRPLRRTAAASVLALLSGCFGSALVSQAPSRLHAEGSRLVDDRKRPFSWRGITAFRLAEQIASGRERDAAAFLDWAKGRELTVVRVLVMARDLFELPPEKGLSALPRLLQLAAARGLYVEVVALADTAAYPELDVDAFIRRVGAVCAAHPNALLELANEPHHPTQTPAIHRPEDLHRLRALVPPDVPVAAGAGDTVEESSGGDYVTFHFPRLSGDGGWAHVKALARGADDLRRMGKPLVNDEPIGAAAASEPGRRDSDPVRFRAAALLSRMAGMGATFHYEGGLHARRPDGREAECFAAWHDAWRLLPPDLESRARFVDLASSASAVRAVDRAAALGFYEARSDRETWVLAIGVAEGRDLGLAWKDGWRGADVTVWPGLALVRGERAP
jgi:hypothetical protein